MRTIGAAILAVACGGDGHAWADADSGVATTVPTATAVPVDADAAPAASPDAASVASSNTLALRYSAELAPGEESNVCAVVDGPSKLAWVTGWQAKLSAVHHAGVWLLPPGAKVNPESCGTGTAGLLFTALSEASVDIPAEGGALRVPAGYRFVLDVHRLNVAPAPVTATATISLRLTDTPTTEVFTSYADGHTFSIAPMSRSKASFACKVPANVLFASMAIHTHSHTVAAHAGMNGADLYSLTNWAEPTMQTYAPFAPGTLEWSCDIANDTANPMTFGLGRDTGEMCQVYAFTLGARWVCSI